MTITIKDIAHMAGVSYSTVSKALNDSPLVKSATKVKVIKIAKELGYEPNFAAQQLVSKQSKVIGLIWPTLERTAPSTLVTKINEEISKNSYSMILSINSIKTSLEMFKRFQVDGVVVFDENNYEELESFTLPFVTYGVGKDKPFPVVDVNYQKAMHMAVEYLYTLGHENISYVGDFTPIDDRQIEKYLGFQRTMSEFGLPIFNSNLINSAGLEVQDGYLATCRLLNSPFHSTAIIGASYDLSAGIVRALRERNYIVPKDISVIGYDNIPQMASMEIPLTSVGVPIEDIAHQMVHTLFACIKDKDHVPHAMPLSPSITERSSCARVSISKW